MKSVRSRGRDRADEAGWHELKATHFLKRLAAQSCAAFTLNNADNRAASFARPSKNSLRQVEDGKAGARGVEIGCHGRIGAVRRHRVAEGDAAHAHREGLAAVLYVFTMRLY